jgi:hypothetical protein
MNFAISRCSPFKISVKDVEFPTQNVKGVMKTSEK